MNLLIIASIVMLLLGFFNPKASMFWYRQGQTKAMSAVIYGGLFLILAYVNGHGADEHTLVPPAAAQTETLDSATVKLDSGTTSQVVADVPPQTEEDRVTTKLKAIAERDWPNDYSTQEYWINQELEDYRYMLTIPDNAIKRQANRDWPYDYSTQKYWYNQQVEARDRLNGR